jgi:DNA-binding MarR family transcriptional regulator
MVHRPPARPAKRSRRFDSPQQEAFLQLWRTYDRLKAIEDDLFAQHGLSAQQYNALRLLQAAHPQPVPTLALGSRLVSRAPDMTRLLDKLQERGLIQRERLADNRRVVAVSITSAGIDLLNRLAELVVRCHAKQLGHLSQRQLRQLTQLLIVARAPHDSPTGMWSQGS